jgi:hypothetical protein
LGGRLYPFSGEQVRVREADREITGLCAWGDKVYRKDRPEREEARGLRENENSTPIMPYCFLTILTGRNLPKIQQPRDVEPSTINEKTIADFTRVVEQTGILERRTEIARRTAPRK